MDPRAAKLAMDQMSKMDPQQLQSMMKIMPQNISPDMMSAAMAQMQNMRPEDWDAASRQMASMSPDDMARQAATLNTQMSAQQQYVMTASTQLKAEGNQLHSAGRYLQAVEKYTRAKTNVVAHTSTAAADLRKACSLNLSSCYLNLGQYGLCVEQCDEVLAGDAENMKALYRRGQAHMGLGKMREAVADLTAALKAAAGDATQQAPIKEKLEEAMKQVKLMPAEPAAAQSRPVGDSMTAAAASAADNDFRQASKVDMPIPAASTNSPTSNTAVHSSTTASVAPTRSSSSSSSFGGNTAAALGGIDPKVAAQVLGNMSDEQLASMTANMPAEAGGMKMTPQMARLAASMVGNMSAEEMAQMQKLAAEMGKSKAGGASASTSLPAAATGASAGSTVGASSSGAIAVPHAGGSGSGMPALTPEMAKMASEMMSKMSADDMNRMTQMAAGMQGGAGAGISSSGLTPPGMPNITPEMAKMASDMMSKMSPEDMARMSQMASSMGGGISGRGMPGGPLSGGACSASIMSMMDSPGMMERAMSMMSGMDAASLASMLLSQGMAKSPEQAESMAKQMKSIKPETMKRMMQVGKVVAKAGTAVQAVKAWAMANLALVIGLLLLLLALLARWLGFY